MVTCLAHYAETLSGGVVLSERDAPRIRIASSTVVTTSTLVLHVRKAPLLEEPALSADLVAGLRRVKLARVRRLAPELCLTARTQRWAPEVWPLVMARLQQGILTLLLGVVVFVVERQFRRILARSG